MATTFSVIADDYYYTHTAKFKAVGDNCVTNGSFEQFFEAWTNDLGGELNSSVWGIEPAAGPNGENAAIVTQSGNIEGDGLARVFTLDPGTYVVSYYIKGESALSTSITIGGMNYLNIFTNADAALTPSNNATVIATPEPFGSEWQQIVNIAQVDAAQHLVFIVNQMTPGTLITNVEIRQAIEVYDTRQAERLISYAEQLAADENLPENRDEVIGAIEGMLKPALQDPSQCDDFATMESMLDLFQAEVLTPFLDANGANLVGTTLTDWSTWGGANYNSMTNRGTWTFEGGRWGFFPNDAFAVSSGTTTLEFNPGDGYIATAGIQTGQKALNVGVRTLAGALDNVGPGKYFFSIEAQAVAAANRANPYGSNHAIAIVGPNIYVGDQNEVLENDTLNGYYWKTYYMIAEIHEGEELKVGFHFPVLEGMTGGRYSVRNPQVRLLGVTTDEVEFNNQKEAFLVQQYNLGQRLANYPVELAEYPWEKDSLDRALALAQPVYDASLLIIDTNGNVLNRSMVNEEQTQLLLDEVNRLGRARSYILTQNAPIDALKDALQNGKAALTNPANAGADATYRTALQDAINAGEALLAALSSENQGALFNETAIRIKKAQEEFEATAASRANPTNILIANADFSEFASNSNITTEGEHGGWQWTIGDGMSRWEIRDNETLGKGHGATCWRGTTAGPNGRVMQLAELTYEGLYEYRAKAYISEERVNELVAAAQIVYDANEMPIDTIYQPGIRLFFGQEGAPDSITVSKCYMGVKDDGTYFERTANNSKYPGMVYATYSVFFKKEGTSTTNVEFGLEAYGNLANAGANGFGFGENQLLYVGNEQKYLDDTRAELNNIINDAMAANVNTDNYWGTKLSRYISDGQQATTAKEMQNAIHGIREIASRLGFSLSGITEIKDERLKMKDGVYDLLGRQLKMKDEKLKMKKGLYIVNGKKQIVK
jgi:hypothetical protein